MVMKITLLGGPKDGMEFYLSDERWFSGELVLLETRPIKWVTELGSPAISEIPKEVIYVRQRFHQGWDCLTQDLDGVVKRFNAAEPEFKWVYLNNNWTKF
jgi:hypothetical protein